MRQCQKCGFLIVVTVASSALGHRHDSPAFMPDHGPHVEEYTPRPPGRGLTSYSGTATAVARAFGFPEFPPDDHG